jgi:hypothetical protein
MTRIVILYRSFVNVGLAVKAGLAGRRPVG